MSECIGINGEGLVNLGCSIKYLDISNTRDSVIEKALQLYGVTESNKNVTQCNIQQGSQGGKRKTRSLKKKRGKSRKHRH